MNKFMKQALSVKNNDLKNELLALRDSVKALIQANEVNSDLSTLEYIEQKLFIKTKDARLIKLQLNTPQTKIYNIIQDLKAQDKPLRLIILKARQEGVSTLVESLIFENTARNPNINSMIVAHDTEGSDHIFSMSTLMYNCLPDGEKPSTRYSNRKELDFSAPLNSRIQVDTAGQTGNQSVGRSFTIQNFHGSEVAFWADAKNVMLGVMQAIPDHANTMIVLESTANGIGDYFYNEYFRAKEGKSDFTAIFLPWFDMPEYVKGLECSEQSFIATLDDEERLLIERFSLSLGQIAWRRWAIENKCGGDRELFKQEYPSEDIEAFLVSGRPVFDVSKLQGMLAKVKEPLKVGYLTSKGFDESDKGYIKVWQEPVKGKRYVMGADVAEGLEHGDYSCAVVYDVETLGQVAEWHGHVDPDVFAIELERLGKYYNDAYIGVESNNHGLSTINRLKETYLNMYMRKVYDQMSDKWVDKWGWETNLKTKPLMIDAFREVIREGLIGLVSYDLVYECMTYVLDEKGRANAQAGCFDDRVVAAMIGLKVYQEVPKGEFKVRNYLEAERPETINKDRIRKQWEKAGLVWDEKDDEYNALKRVMELHG